MSPFLDIRQLSDYLCIKRSTLYAWAAQGKIPCLKLHGLLRFRRVDIEHWIDSCQVPANTGIDQQAPSPGLRDDLDTLIARAKGQVYNPVPRGNQTEIKPHRKGGA
ncbi:MAG: helix-turn-helix domain-containing protein [Terriglobia bacterium]